MNKIKSFVLQPDKPLFTVIRFKKHFIQCKKTLNDIQRACCHENGSML